MDDQSRMIMTEILPDTSLYVKYVDGSHDWFEVAFFHQGYGYELLCVTGFVKAKNIYVTDGDAFIASMGPVNLREAPEYGLRIINKINEGSSVKLLRNEYYWDNIHENCYLWVSTYAGSGWINSKYIVQ